MQPCRLATRDLLVAYDASPASGLALAHAVTLAQAYRARPAIVAVVSPPPLLSWQAPGGMRGVDEDGKEALTTGLCDAADGDHDLIVTGARGATGSRPRSLARSPIA